ncbi:MAG: hypothetical protein ACI9AU_000630 [Bacteroidia bacterium]|jgi:hypothetical protein
MIINVSEIIHVINEKNSRNGTIDKRRGESWKAMDLFNYTLRDLPPIYNKRS